MGRLTETQARIVLALALNGMRASTAADALHYGRTTVTYYLNQIRERTGLNPRDFYDLQKLVKMARATLGEEAEHD
jgi:sugar diacid utilization regulator